MKLEKVQLYFIGVGLNVSSKSTAELCPWLWETGMDVARTGFGSGSFKRQGQ